MNGSAGHTVRCRACDLLGLQEGGNSLFNEVLPTRQPAQDASDSEHRVDALTKLVRRVWRVISALSRGEVKDAARRY
jgi:hypothetical protein